MPAGDHGRQQCTLKAHEVSVIKATNIHTLQLDTQHALSHSCRKVLFSFFLSRLSADHHRLLSAAPQAR